MCIRDRLLKTRSNFFKINIAQALSISCISYHHLKPDIFLVIVTSGFSALFAEIEQPDVSEVINFF